MTAPATLHQFAAKPDQYRKKYQLYEKETELIGFGEYGQPEDEIRS